MQLVYRANRYNYVPSCPRPTRPLRAVNWRYALGHATAKVGETADVPQLRQPRAINWRFLAAVEA